MTNPTRDPIEAAINALIAETGTVCPSGAIGQYIEADSIEDLRDGMIAAIAAYLEAQWQPIETAPKDGTVVWAYHPCGALGGLRPACRAVAWNSGGYWETDSCYGSAESSTGFTMWCLPPKPPKESK
jgi:hypothetical protein